MIHYYDGFISRRGTVNKLNPSLNEDNPKKVTLAYAGY